MTGSACLLSPSFLLSLSTRPLVCIIFHCLFSFLFVSSPPQTLCPSAGESTIVKASHGAWPWNWETYHGPIQSLQEVRGHRLLQCAPLPLHPPLRLYFCALVETLHQPCSQQTPWKKLKEGATPGQVIIEEVLIWFKWKLQWFPTPNWAKI